MKQAIIIKNLSVYYGNVSILQNINCTIQAGSLIAIVGPNGGGKTTFIQSIMGIMHGTGSITILGEPINTKYHNIAYIPQRNGIDWNFPASVFDVAIMGRYKSLKIGQRPRQQDISITQQALDQVGMLELAHHPISELSGGQQQRIFLARALAQQADFFILDEPFVGVDTITEEIMLNLFIQLQQQGKTIIVVHHNLMTVKKYFDSIMFINREKIAHGPIATTMTAENIAKTFHININTHDFNFL